MDEKKNYNLFWSMLWRMPYRGDKFVLKETLVSEYSHGETVSLKLMKKADFDEMIKDMQKQANDIVRQKKLRSVCLRLMQRLGIDTLDWERVNAFCKDPRIAGKRFSFLRNCELEELQKKLRNIERKGGLKQKETAEDSVTPTSTGGEPRYIGEAKGEAEEKKETP